MLPKEREDALGLLAISFVCTFAVSLATIVACLAAPAAMNGLMKTAGFWPLALLVLSTLISGLNYACQAWAVRVKAFKVTSSSQVIRSLAGKGTSIGFGVLKLGAPGLIISNILGNAAASVNLVRVLRPDLPSLLTKTRRAGLAKLAREYRDFPMYSASQNVINAISAGLPVLLLTRFFGLPIAGAYAFAMTVLTFPMGFILSSLRQVLFQKASESQHQGRSLAALYVKVTATLFAMVLDPDRRHAHLGTATLRLGLRSAMVHGRRAVPQPDDLDGRRLLQPAGGPLRPDHQDPAFRVSSTTSGLLAARTAALVLGGLFLTAYQTVMAYALVGAVMNVFLIVSVGRAIMKKEGPLNMDSLKSFLIED